MKDTNMEPSQVSAIRSIFASSLENFFKSKTDKEIQEMILVPYREAREDFERGLLTVENSGELVLAH